MLRSLNPLHVYDSSTSNIAADLIVPLLSNSIDYLRGVGYFSSGWLSVASQGLVNLVERGGKARIVVSPTLEEQDWEAIQQGEKAKFDEALRSILARNIRDLAEALRKDTLNALAWMVADGVAEFRFAIPRDRNSGGDYHDKVGIFTDEQSDIVAIHGSLNDSIRGTLNGEAYSVFGSWSEGQSPYVDLHKGRLMALWENRNSQFRVCEIPEVSKEQLIQLRTSASRPYRFDHSHLQLQGPRCAVELHDYQKKAIEAWEAAGCHGVFEMATGTGKTITALAAAVGQFHKRRKIALIILVPYLHLLDQWADQCRKNGFRPIYCSGEHQNWAAELGALIQDFKMGLVPHLTAIVVHATSASDRFRRVVASLDSTTTMVIGDEAHRLGAPILRKVMEIDADMRLGLSATPKRWFDEEGTSAIFSYFGETCFEYPLEAAIGKYLTPYVYNPVLVHLTDEEMEAYEMLTARIAALLHAESKETPGERRERMKYLLLERARIVSTASRKLPALLNSFQRVIDEGGGCEGLKGILVYCAPGEHQLALRELSVLGVRCHEFVHTVSLTQREELLKYFVHGKIQVLVSMKCLDEGVDVPSTKTAFILASSTNPREFVQRRGRILRLSPGKTEAIIYDFLVVPSPEQIKYGREAAIALLRREMPRFAEFASGACNQFAARETVWHLLNSLGMLHLLDRKPWEIYQENRNREEIENLYD